MMKHRLLFYIAICLSVSLCEILQAVEPEEISVKVGRTRGDLKTLTADSSITAIAAVCAVGGISGKEVILILRSGKFYIIGNPSRGGRNVILKAGDEISLLWPGIDLESFLAQHPSTVVGVEAMRALSASDGE